MTMIFARGKKLKSVAVAAELIQRQGASSRVSTLAGDYHTAPFPSGTDAVNFFGMLHQESPEARRLLARKAFEALEPYRSAILGPVRTHHGAHHATWLGLLFGRAARLAGGCRFPRFRSAAAAAAASPLAGQSPQASLSPVRTDPV